MGKKLQRTDAKQWHKATELVEMPSGMVAELQRINLVTMIAKHDDVPNFLLMKVHEKLDGAAKPKVLTLPDAAPDAAPDKIGAAQDALGAILWLAKAVFVYPKLVDGEPQNDDEVNIGHISLDDLTFASGYAVGDASLVETVQRFRDVEASDVEPVSAGEDVDGEAV